MPLIRSHEEKTAQIQDALLLLYGTIFFTDNQENKLTPGSCTARLSLDVLSRSLPQITTKNTDEHRTT